jgi:hypothetical protein
MTDDLMLGGLHLFGRTEEELQQIEARNPTAFARALTEAMAVSPPAPDWRDMVVVQPYSGVPTGGLKIDVPKVHIIEAGAPIQPGMIQVNPIMMGLEGPAQLSAFMPKQVLYKDLLGSHFDRSYYVEGHMPVFDLAESGALDPSVTSHITHETAETLRTGFTLKFPGFGGSKAHELSVETSVDFEAIGAFQLACTAIFRVDRYHNPGRGTVSHEVHLEELRTPVFQCRAPDAEFTPITVSDWQPRKIGSTFQPLKQVIAVAQSGGLSADVSIPLGGAESGKSLGISCSIETSSALKLTVERDVDELVYPDVSASNPLAMRIRKPQSRGTS